MSRCRGAIIVVIVIRGIRLVPIFLGTFSAIGGVAKTAATGVVSVWMDGALSLIIQALSLEIRLTLTIKGARIRFSGR